MKKLLAFLALALIASTSFAGVISGSGHYVRACWSGSTDLHELFWAEGEYTYSITAECNNIDARSYVQIVDIYQCNLYDKLENTGGEETITGTITDPYVYVDMFLQHYNGDVGSIYAWCDFYPTGN